MRKPLLLAVCLLALAGCGTDVKTAVEIDSATQSTIQASVTFTGEVADEIRSNKAYGDQLRKTIDDRSSSDVQVDDSDGAITYSTDLTYQELTESSDLLGVSSLGMEAVGDDVRLNATIVKPTRLLEAIDGAVAGQDDGAATAAAVRGTTNVTFAVHYPGGVKDAKTSDGLESATKDGTASITQSLSDYKEGTFEVTGDPTAPFVQRYKYLLGGFGLLCLAAGGAALVRSRRG